MVCLVVTRGGFGDVWRFADKSAAYLHPIYQFGDAMLQGLSDVVDNYSVLEWNTLRVRLGLVAVAIPNGMRIRQERLLKESQSAQIWERLQLRAEDPPTDTHEMCRRITEDRRQDSTMAKKTKKAAEMAVAVPVADSAAEAAPAKSARNSLPPPTKGPKGVPNTAIIRMGTDKNGASYGPDNNPKKPGTKTHERFQMYVDGITVADAIAAGIPTGDLSYDRDKHFIRFDYAADTAADPDPEPEAPAEDDGDSAEEPVEDGDGEGDGGDAEDGEAAADPTVTRVHSYGSAEP